MDKPVEYIQFMPKKQQKKTNDVSFKYINIDIDVPESQPHSSEYSYHSQSKAIRLATELAYTLEDTKSMKFYLKIVMLYPEAFLREKLAEVMTKPLHEITKNRGAYFNYLIQTHGEPHRHNSWN